MSEGRAEDAPGIRRARPDEYAELGRMLVEVYSSTAGMPRLEEQPGYYAMLRDVAARASRPALQVLVAVDGTGRPVGCVDFISDMAQYGSGGTARNVPDAAGIRLLAVDPGSRGRGVGKALTLACIDRARGLGRSAVILHTTRGMQTAWAMYERLGFERFPEIDFRQEQLEVFGFRLQLAPRG